MAGLPETGSRVFQFTVTVSALAFSVQVPPLYSPSTTSNTSVWPSETVAASLMHRSREMTLLMVPTALASLKATFLLGDGLERLTKNVSAAASFTVSASDGTEMVAEVSPAGMVSVAVAAV